MKKTAKNWNVYCTRFLVKARQLTSPLTFVDVCGHEHRGRKGDYFVESIDGKQVILARKFFEDVYITMGPARKRWQVLAQRKMPPQSTMQAIARQSTDRLPSSAKPRPQNLPAKQAAAS